MTRDGHSNIRPRPDACYRSLAHAHFAWDWRTLSFAGAYERILRRLIRCPDFEVSPHGEPTRELANVRFQFPLRDQGCFRGNGRETELRYLAGELLWYFSARNDLAFIERYSKFWRKVANPDGSCNSAYGKLLFHPSPVMHPTPNTEWAWAVSRLSQDADSRQAVMVLNQPRHHWDGNKDVPCTLNLGFLARDGRLHLHAVMRSNDVWRGLPFDVPFFLLLARQMQANLRERGMDVHLGTYTHTSFSTHAYARDLPAIQRLLERRIEPWAPMPLESFPSFIDAATGQPLEWVCALAQGEDAADPQSLAHWLWTHAHGIAPEIAWPALPRSQEVAP